MMASERIEDKQIEMLLDVKPNVPYALCGDKTSLLQILKNILDNAAKYTDAGHIILTISIKKYIIDRQKVVLTEHEYTELSNTITQTKNTIQSINNN